MMQEFFVFTTLYNTVANRTPRRVIRAGINWFTSSDNGSGTGDVASCPNPTVTSICIWNGRIGNIGKTTDTKFRETRELHTSMDR